VRKGASSISPYRRSASRLCGVEQGGSHSVHGSGPRFSMAHCPSVAGGFAFLTVTHQDPNPPKVRWTPANPLGRFPRFPFSRMLPHSGSCRIKGRGEPRPGVLHRSRFRTVQTCFVGLPSSLLGVPGQAVRRLFAPKCTSLYLLLQPFCSR